MFSLMLWLAVVAGTVATGSVIALGGWGRLAITRADHQRRRLPGGHPWRHIGRQLRLRYTAGHGALSHRLDGSASGRAVVVRLQRSTSEAVLTEAEVQPRMPMSTELCFDSSGPAATAAGLLPTDSVLASVERLVIGPMGVRGIVCGVAVEELAGLVSELVSLCLALEARSRAPWRLAARRYQLASQIVDEERALSGPELTVRIREVGAPSGCSGAPLPVEPGALRDPETV
ncbi:MAG: hypothetical protein ACI8S6_005985, partial [Myxococcota bacterium]